MKATFSSIGLAAVILASTAAAQSLDKAPATDNLDYLLDGLTSALPETGQSNSGVDSIPQDCIDMAEGESLSGADVSAVSVTYEDCGDPWIICRHKDAGTSMDDMIKNFGKLPVKTRQWVRHMIALPGDSSAYNAGGNICMFGTAGESMTVWMHEAAHSLDLLGAYPLNPLSDSQDWLDAYNAAEAVPDPYAQSNQVENVAQNTVMAAFDINVEGGLGGANSDAAGKTEPQWSLIRGQSEEAGDILKPGGECTRRLENSKMKARSNSRIMRALEGRMPSFPTSEHLTIIEARDFRTERYITK